MNYIDCHADTLTQIPKGKSLWKNTCSLDLSRVRKFAEKHTQIFAIWNDRAKIRDECLEKEFMRLYDRAVSLLQSEPESVMWCTNASDMQSAHGQKKTAAFLSVEDVSIMGSLAARIRELGIRFAQLSWNYENEYACGAVAEQGQGLSAKGTSLVKDLLQQKITLDISHLSDQGVEDIFSLTEKPVIASHSNVREVCAHPRNLKKEHIKELIRRRGLLGINFYAPFVGTRPGISDFIRHIDAVCELGGEDILAIGSDFDGCSQFPEGIRDVSSIPGLYGFLEKSGFGKQIVEKIFFGNAARFLKYNVK